VGVGPGRLLKRAMYYGWTGARDGMGIGCGREQQLDVTSIDGSNLMAIMHSTVGAVAGLSFGGVASIGVANSNGQTPLPTGRIRARVFGLAVDAG
jgi:hypothetical protein